MKNSKQAAKIGGYFSVEDGYHGDLGLAPVLDFNREPVEASVDGQGGTIRGKPVFTWEEAAYYLNRGDGLVTIDGVTYETGAQWYGAKGGHNEEYYFLAESKADNDGTLDTLTFGFYETQISLPEPYVYRGANGNYYLGMQVASGFSAFDADQRAAARQAVEMWDDLIDVSFIETHFSEGDINFMNTTTGPAQASAYLPYDYGESSTINYEGENVSFAEISGDVYVNPNQATNHQFDEGQYGLTTLIHELGHTLGLEHPGAYNFGPNFTATYVNGAEYYQDSLQYSIMSYWGAAETGAAHIDWNTFQFVYASTPVVHDIAAIQRIYGADMTTRTGDTVYGFNSNAGHDAYDFTVTPMAVIGIWDAGGNDTLDLSGYNSDSSININEGQFTSAGGSGVVPLETLIANGVRPAGYTQAQYDDIRARYNSLDGLLHDNISIAYGVTIENAIGGGGNDIIYANQVANVLTGNGGVDTASYDYATAAVVASLATGGTGGFAAGDSYIGIENLEGSDFGDTLRGNSDANKLLGGAGADTLDGSGGFDTASYMRATAGVSASLSTMRGTGGEAGGDRFTSIEALEGSNFGDTLTGGSYNDTLSGLGGDDDLIGGNGSDRLDGGAGNDLLDGGNGADTLLGGAGNDTLRGGNDGDSLNGGAGDDSLSGGNGNDIFLFTETGGKDSITDFRRGQDSINLSAIDAIAGGSDDAFSWIGSSAFGNVAGQLRSYNSGGVNVLAGDVNGDGIADFTIVTGNVSIIQSDVVL